MSAILKILRQFNSDIGAEEKFFLASFVMEFEWGTAVHLTVMALAERLNLSPRAVMQATSKLSAGAYLVVNKVSTGRGRPSRSYEIGPAILALIEGQSVDSCPSICEQIIKQLLTCSGELVPEQYTGSCEAARSNEIGFKQPPVRKKTDRLSTSNRWLLAVLVSHADKLGVVRGLGMSRLRQLSGLRESTLKLQLNRLVELGLIRSQVPGVSSSFFVGAKISTTFFLNLNHPLLGLQIDGCAVLVLHESGFDRREAFCVRASSNVQPVIERYFRQLRAEVFNVFCLRLDGYASYLLASHWNALSSPVCPDLTQTLQDMISADLRRPDDKYVYGLIINELDWAVLIEYLGWLALERARGVKDLLARMPMGDFSGARIELIPTPDQGNGTQITTVLMEHAPLLAVSGLVIRYVPPYVCEWYERENELVAEQRYRFGLLTRSNA